MTLQHEDPATIRATLAAFFTVGSLASLLGLVVAGELTGSQVRWGAILVPFLVVGFVLAGPVTRRLEGNRMRVAMLVFCLVSGASIILRAALG
jgi:uncharacterized membrane protein YfcA